MSIQKFNVEEANREPSIPVDIASRGEGLFVIPGISETKEYGRANNLNYAVPRFVGLNHYYICTKYKKKKEEFWTTQINPIILSTEGLVYVEETQHGVEGTYLVPRHPRILVAYTEAPALNPVQRELIGLASLQFQQAMHAANGLFISDFGLRIDDNPGYLNGSDEERAKIINDYFKALKESYEKELEENQETKDYVKATEFIADNISKNIYKEAGVLPTWVEKELKKEDESQ